MYGSGKNNRNDNDRDPIFTKENFWNEIERKCPSEYKKMGDWINEYKERNGWNKLFGEFAPKVHELPVAMQIGIFIQYIQESECLTPFEPDISDMETIGQAMEEWFAEETFKQRNLHKPGREVRWDSDPSSDECIIFRGKVVSDDGRVVIIDSPMYQKHLLSFWNIKDKIVANKEIIHAKESSMFRIARDRVYI